MNTLLNNKLSEAEILRQRAEELLTKQTSKKGSKKSDVLKLNHEITVFQLELEIQNQELIDAKENLDVSLEKYIDLYDFAPSGFLTLTRGGQIMGLNLCASMMLGIERSHLMKTLFGSYLTDDTKQLFYNFLNKIFINQVGQSCEMTLNNKSSLPVYVYLNGVLSKNGLYADISMMDITERKLAEEKLIISNKELKQSLQLNTDKDLFISILAHDLRNPFGVLLGYTELLKNAQQLNGSEVNNLVNEIYRSTLSTYNLLEDLLKWSRLRMGKFPFEPRSVSFSDLCIDIENFLSPIAETKKITIKCFADKEINVLADVDMLKAVFRNLISNAIKFTRENGIIKISAEQTSSSIIFSISDNGIGIEHENLIKLFDISQLHTSKGTENEKGTGLGLLLCKDFVEKHGGKIWVESEYGKGSVFYFTIPYKSVKREKNIIEDSDKEVHDYNLKVLIADDEEGLRLILGMMMKSYCREILVAENGFEAVAICKNNPDIDLILIDMNMPKMNGSEAVKLIRMINKEVIIIAETGKILSEISEELGYGINDYFFKPYHKTFLNELIIKHFRNKNKNQILIDYKCQTNETAEDFQPEKMKLE